MRIKKDIIEIVRRLKERNPDFFEQIKDKTISLEDFAEIVITQFCSFNRISMQTPDININVPYYPYRSDLPLSKEHLEENKKHGYNGRFGAKN